jgi:hypothetical protein
MAALLSALVIPGAGQFYNGEKKKGVLVAGASIVSLVALFTAATVALWRILPPDFDPNQKEMLQALMNRVLLEHGGLLSVFEALLVVLWLFGLVDAFIVAKRRL